jgi:peptidoglycan/LPS O-acetylase OafA/YrhL
MALLEPNNKITFANQLRGFAVICVVVTHYFGLYWTARPLIAQYILAPVLEGPSPNIIYHLSFPTFNSGAFGVGLFFLISGFVIPFSLTKMGAIRFLIARFLRIFPTYWVASGIMLGVVWLSGRYWGHPFLFNAHQIAVNLLLVHMQAIQPTFDLVNWTLTVEFTFYLVAVIMSPFITRSSVLALINLTLAILAFVTWAPASWGTLQPFGLTFSVESTKYQLMLTTFLFIGTLFNFALRDKISHFTLVGATVAIFGANAMMWQKTAFADQFWVVPLNYFYALLIFSACYMLRHKFKPSRLLDFLADISYPLYLLHSIIGYVIIRFATSKGIPSVPAEFLAFAIVVVLAYVVHVLVEQPTANLGKSIGRKPSIKRAPDEIAQQRYQ